MMSKTHSCKWMKVIRKLWRNLQQRLRPRVSWVMMKTGSSCKSWGIRHYMSIWIRWLIQLKSVLRPRLDSQRQVVLKTTVGWWRLLANSRWVWLNWRVTQLWKSTKNSNSVKMIFQRSQSRPTKRLRSSSPHLWTDLIWSRNRPKTMRLNLSRLTQVVL